VGVFVGFDIGGTKCAVIIGRHDGPAGMRLLGKTVFPTTGSPDRVLDLLVRTARLLMERGGAADVEAIGVSCGGPLDSARGVILSPPNLPGWDEIPVTGILSREMNAPAYLSNDANACAFAEWKYGAGRGCMNMVFLTFGTGMGAGLILDGRLYRGTNDLAGEVGHVRLAEDGPEGYGKRGSFEGFCSGGGIAQTARAEAEARIGRGETVSFCKDLADAAEITARDVGEAAIRGDPLAQEILTRSGKYLGRGISILIDVLNPQRIVIGSIYGRCIEFLKPSMEKEIRRQALSSAARVCSVLPAELGEAIGDYAALSIAAWGRVVQS
jgi:glucokinase